MFHRVVLASLTLFFSGISALYAQTGTLSMVSGNGQVVLEQFLTTSPLVVQAKDASGRPISNLPVTWSITQGMGTLVTTTSTTDANGQSNTLFLGTTLQPGLSYIQATVTASSSLGSVSFIVTTTPSRTLTGGNAAPPLVELITPPAENRSITGRAGSTVVGAISIRVVAQSGAFVGQPVPNVGLRLSIPENPNSPTGVCNGTAGIALTNAQGIATCDLVLNN